MSFVDVARIQKAVQAQDANPILEYQRELSTHRLERGFIVQILADKIILQALAHPDQIDGLIGFTFKVAHELSEHVRSESADAQNAGGRVQRNEMKYGGGALFQAIVRQLAEAVDGASIQNVTPDRDQIATLPPNYWHIATVNGLLLARLTTFVFGQETQGSASVPQAEKDKLWDDVISNLLGRTIFSREVNPEPSALIIALALLRGASTTLQSTLKPRGDRVGRGKNWVWYDGAFSKPKATWEWSDVVAAVQQGISGQYADEFKLPDGLVEGYLSLGIKLNDQGEDSKEASAQDETAEKLLSGTFDWVSRHGADATEVSSRIQRATLVTKLHGGLTEPLKLQSHQTLQGRGDVTAEVLRQQVEALDSFATTHKLNGSDLLTKHLVHAEVGSSTS